MSYAQEEGVVCFGEYGLYLPENATSLKGVRLEKNGKKVYTYKKLANSGELPPLDKTPEVFALSDTPRILIPEGGYSALRKGEYTVDEDVEDIYLLLCNGDAKKLRKLYVELTGKSELVRLSALGGWNSKYYAYSEEEAKQLILDYEAHNIPLDVMVIDTDWRSCENGWGYDINAKLFPDMKRFLDFAHSHGVEIMFNDHPEPVNGAKVFAPEEIEYREKNLQSLMEKGLDIWWYDRNWMTRLETPSPNVRWETLGLYLFEDITRHHWQKKVGDQDIYRRPVIMGNVVNINNGAYDQITDSASHRYSIQWTGDIASDYKSLAQEIENLLAGGNNCIAYINSDCGGHIGDPTKEQFIRWMQFGTLSPVFRPHCTMNLARNREPWVFDKETEDIVRDFNNLRYRLLPVIYKNAYENYATGEPIFKSLGWEFPNDKKAAARSDEYMLGNDLLFAPVTGVKIEPLRYDEYTETVKATFFQGRELQGTPIARAEYRPLYIDSNGTAPLEGVPPFNYSARFETTLQVGAEKQLFLKSDDGATVWLDGKKVLEDKTTHGALLQPLGMLSENVPHKVKIEYFQADGAAFCSLYTTENLYSDLYKEVYLPAGKWLDSFEGKIYEGGKTVAREYTLHETPLFIRMGALISLAHEARNTKEQKWNKLVYDFYPCKEANDAGYLYEDDTETTAYKLGQFRKSAYKAGYCRECNAYVVNLFKAEGTFAGDKCYNDREITFKVHLLDKEQIKRVTVNGEEVAFKTATKNASAFPLNTGETAPECDTLLVTVKTQVEKDYEIKFYL